jgi:AbrB family looped-hinge helix DNA binding protein
MASTKLGSKFQAIIPAEVRKLLGLKRGDVVLFSITKKKTVEVCKASAKDLEYLSSLEKTLTEWESEEDEKPSNT